VNEGLAQAPRKLLPSSDSNVRCDLRRVRMPDTIHLLSGRNKTVSILHVKEQMGLSVERRADSPSYWKD
jgi:hypothetical protein